MGLDQKLGKKGKKKDGCHEVFIIDEMLVNGNFKCSAKCSKTRHSGFARLYHI